MPHRLTFRPLAASLLVISILSAIGCQDVAAPAERPDAASWQLTDEQSVEEAYEVRGRFRFVRGLATAMRSALDRVAWRQSSELPRR